MTMMNWLWDTTLTEKEVSKILKEPNNIRFDIYAEKLFSRTNDPQLAFKFVDKITFCKKWVSIKNRMKKDAWQKTRTVYWQTIYDSIKIQMRREGINIRDSKSPYVPQIRREIANQLMRIRKGKGYKQKDLARKLGVIQQQISRIESGQENCTINTLNNIARALGKKLTVKII